MRHLPEFGPFAASYFKWLFVFSLATNLLLVAPSIHTLQVYDRILRSGSYTTLLYLSIIVLVALALSSVADYCRRIIAARLSNRYVAETYDRLINVLTRRDHEDADSASVLRDFNAVRSFLASRTLIGVFDLPFSGLFLIFLYLLNVWLGLLVSIAFVAMIVLAQTYRRLNDKARDKSRDADNEAFGFASASLRKTEEIQAMGMLPRLQERWALKLLNAMEAGETSGGMSARFSVASRLIRQVLQILVISTGAFLVLSGHMSGGMLFAASLIANRVLSPLDQVIGGWEPMMRALRAHDEITVLLANEDGAESRNRLPPAKGRVSVDRVGFDVEARGEKKTLLDDVSFRIEPGEIVVAVGPSGSGKSTLARVLSGAVRPTRGIVRLDGAAQDQWRTDQWGQSIGYVAQDIEFFPLSVAENIARLTHGFDEDKLLNATRLAGVHELITSMPEGYATKIGPGGFRLSGGQKQKIALARALFGDPVFLVLDEPDAHLDEKDFERFLRTLRKLRRAGRSVFVISHRPAVAEIGDRVLHMADGMILEGEQPVGRGASLLALPEKGETEGASAGPEALEERFAERNRRSEAVS